MSARGRLVKRRIYSAVDKSKIKDKRKVKPKDKSWVKKVGGLKQERFVCSKTLAWYQSPQCHFESIQCGASDHTFRECIPNNNCLEEERTFKIVSPALVCFEGMYICLT